ncbi:MAG: hypothetical protein ISR61_04465 [Desulfobacteraceae bacterium]|uniref:Uncharacterized protein n=1 Tax=Candidatus Desulfacyla euxinica TaxID=2841693 RepID=A0A8J6N3G7_9DELT|nr:hypothetical protein [Candidatus Desulfacyla euxinica]MBL6978180.1 hypothetical protein [Desulfobacteraceae bacterium]MBL7217417.1 hypothetical protein [Desulfobacteraceae bacterium]
MGIGVQVTVEDQNGKVRIRKSINTTIQRVGRPAAILPSICPIDGDIGAEEGLFRISQSRIKIDARPPVYDSS